MIQRLRGLSVGRKITCAFVLVCLLCASITAVSLVQLSQAQERLQVINAKSVAGQQTLGQVRTQAQRATKDLFALALAPSADAQATFEETLADVHATWAEYRNTNPEVPLEQLDAVDAALTEYSSGTAALALIALSGDQERFMSTRNDDSLAVSDGAIGRASLNDSLEAVQASASADAAADAAAGATAYDQARLLLLAVTVLVVLLAVSLSLLITRSVVGPLARVVTVVQGLAGGHLDDRVRYDASDEVGQLASAVDTTMDNLTVTMRRIASASATLATSSKDLTAVATQLSQGAVQTSSQSQVVSAATEEISTSIDTVAAAGDQMSAAIREIAASTAEASQVASAAALNAADTSATLGRLSESSRQIGEVVKLITSIAEQTNLLALNATIEAARAGEMGKGFAVVAGEVKELAQQTARATEEIVGRISATQADATAAAGAIEQITEVIGRIDGLQSTIAAAVEEQSATTTEMVRNVKEVSTGSREISANISGIAAAVEDTTNGAEQTEATAGEVSRAATELHQLVGSFTFPRT